MLRCGGFVLLWSAAALANPGTLEGERRELALDDVRVRGVHAQGFAQLSGGATDAPESDAAVGGEVRVSGARCDYLRVGGQARMAWNRGTRASAEQWASACVPITVMEFGHHLEWDVRPSLLAPLGLRAGTNRRETASFRWQPLRMNAHRLLHSLHDPDDPTPRPPLDPDIVLPPGDLVIFDVRTDWTFLWSSTTPLSMRQTVEVAPFRYIRDHTAQWGEPRDFVVDVFQAGGEFTNTGVGEESSGSGVELWVARVEHLELGPVYASAGIGWSSAGAGAFVSEFERQIEVTKPRALLSVETGGKHVHGHVRATHDVRSVPDGYIAIDSRLTAGVGMVAPHTHVMLEGALGRTEVLVPGEMPLHASAPTGGVSLSAARHLNKYLQATVLVEAAQSFYAPAATSLDFKTRWGVQAFGALQATVGR